MAKAKPELEEFAVPEAAASGRGHDDAEGKAAPDLLAAFTPLRAYAQKVLSAPAGRLQNLLSLGEALALLQDETVAAAQAARLGTCLRDAEDAARLAETQEAAEGPEAAAPKKAKSDQAWSSTTCDLAGCHGRLRLRPS